VTIILHEVISVSAKKSYVRYLLAKEFF